MKKYLIILGIGGLMLLFSCKKERLEPTSKQVDLDHLVKKLNASTDTIDLEDEWNKHKYPTDGE